MSPTLNIAVHLVILFVGGLQYVAAQCFTGCPVNACPSGNPLRAATGALFTCSWMQDNCPPGYWCHVGYDVSTTVCCPITPDLNNPCSGPINVGQGTSQIQRFYFDQATRTCQSFYYKGIRGNRNNFVTREQCQTICPERTNPCCCGDPEADQLTGDWRLCGMTGGCSTGYWCHIGATVETTACCPGAAPDACSTALSAGIGTDQLQRWYYNGQTRQCATFTYNGLRGTQNNFLTKDQCEANCDVFDDPCPFTTGFNSGSLSVASNPIYCGNNRICPNFMWCHVGMDADQTVCCPDLGTDRCQQPREEGDGVGALPRWYVDRNIGLCGECRQFTYSGTRGNQNNFLTKAECEQACPRCENPCPSGTPLLDTNGRPISCSQYGACPGTYWCHVGGDSITTVCCPGKTETPCNLPSTPGQGTFSLQRWTFDTSRGLCGECTQFTYRGLKGTQNNFLTRDACERACPSCPNPCRTGTPQAGTDGRPQQCGFSVQDCAPGFWCHYGDSEVTTVCCPGATDNPCQQPLATGQGQSGLARWYLDSTVGLCGSCRQFTYGGLMGNQNNFLTRQDCETACPSEFYCIGCVNPCITGQPLLDTDNRPLECSQFNLCPRTHWCHIGERADTTVCCPIAGDICTQPMLSGTGSANLPRWYYDASRRACLPFVYNGLRGSPNMFLSQTDCENSGCPLWTNACGVGEPLLDGVYARTCNANRPCPTGFYCHVGPVDANLTMCCDSGNLSPCQQPVDYGQGQYSVPRWYYDSNSLTCRQFTYRGMKGNPNNFLTQADCAATCPVYENACSTGTPQLDANDRPVQCVTDGNCNPGNWCHVGDSPETTMCCPNARDPCTQRMSEGDSGRGPPTSLTRWYYDAQYQVCRRFQYRGLRGNQNNFLTRAMCQLECPEVNVCGTGQPLLDPNNSPISCNPNNPSSCPRTHYCHVGLFAIDDFSATTCCPVAGDPCEQPLEEGSVLGTPAQRWYYNKQDDECSQFQYGGMQGNQNNFLSQTECEETCPGFRGLCPHGKPLMSLSLPQTCSIENRCPRGYVCNVGLPQGVAPQGPFFAQQPQQQPGVCCPDPASFCFEPRRSGNCNNFETRYGYEPSSNTCVAYEYSGCGGSQNNFKSLQKCTEVCCDNFDQVYATFYRMLKRR